MLSPDVPEFIPKGMRGPQSSTSPISVSKASIKNSSQSENPTVSKPYQKAIFQDNNHIIKGNLQKDEHGNSSSQNSGRNTKSRQNRHSPSNKEPQTYTKVLSRNEVTHKTTVASRLFKEQHQEELWPSLPCLSDNKFTKEEQKGNKKSEAKNTGLPAQVNGSKENLSLELSNFWQVRKSSNIQQNVLINKDTVNNDANELSGMNSSPKEGKVSQTNPNINKSRKMNLENNISNKNISKESIKLKPRKYKSGSIKDVDKSKTFSQKSETNSQNIEPKSIPLVLETKKELSQDIKKSSEDTNCDTTDFGDESEEWQIQKDRKRKKPSKTMVYNPGTCEDRKDKSNIIPEKKDSSILCKNEDSIIKRKVNKEISKTLQQNNRSNYQKKNDGNSQTENRMKNKTKKELNAQFAQERIRKKKEMNSSGFKKDEKYNKTENLAKKHDETTNILKDKNVKLKKMASKQCDSQESITKLEREQEKYETKTGNNNDNLSKQMSTEEFEKFKAERKIKRKEEKIRKREVRLRKEMAMSRGDSKVMVITREFLEAMTSRTSSSSHIKNEVKETFTDIDNDYPTLDVVDSLQSSEVKKITNNQKDSNLVDMKCEKQIEVNKENQSIETGFVLSSQAPSFSYSSALLTTKKKIVNKSLGTEPSMEVSTETTSKKQVPNDAEMKGKVKNESKTKKTDTLKSNETAAPQKKIKMKDAIEFDLMAAIGTRTTKQKKKIETKQLTVGNLTSKNKGVVALGSKIRGATAAAQPKRGKQREDKNRKKKISVLKKRMKENQGIDGQSLVGILLEAKKLREEDNGIIKASSTNTEDVSKELTILKKPYHDDIDLISCNSLKKQKQNTNLETNILENIDLTECKVQRDSYETNNTSLVNTDNGPQQAIVKSNSVQLENEVSLESDGNQQPLQKLSPEVSEKCKELAKEIMELQDPVHKNSFREYCNHVLTPELDTKAQNLIEALVRFQERQYLKDPVKARIRRRYVCGLKETIKLMGKMSCILVAPDITRSKGPGALDERVEQVLSKARESAVPVIFVLSKRKLGKISRKKGTVSCFGIINYQGAQEFFNEMMELVPAAAQQYEQLVAQGRLIRPTQDTQNLSDDEDILDSIDVIKENNDSNHTNENSKDILDLNKKIIDSLLIRN